MKRILILTLCLSLLCVSALAGTLPVELEVMGDGCTLVYGLPEGVSDIVTKEHLDGMVTMSFVLEDDTMPNYIMVISPSETDKLSGKSMTDLTAQEIEELVAYTAEESTAYDYEMVTMQDGWPAALILNEEGESDWVDAFTVIEGYFIQIHGWHDDFATLTDAENQFAFTLLDNVDILTPEEMAALTAPSE